MQISGSIPFVAAQAYGIPRAATSVDRSPRSLGSSGVVQPRSFPSLPDAARPRSLSNLVAATVNQPMTFDGAATPTTEGTLQLYTRAADKIEAAIAVNVGRAIDVTG